MLAIFNIPNKRGFYLFPCLVILASITSTLVALAHQQPFNVDGILYLNAAAGFLAGGIHQAFAIYQWPFYSILIALVSKITHLPLLNAAFLLNSILNTITFCAFILLVKELGGSRRIQHLALLVIFLYPYLNHEQDNILRNFGYYAFALLSLLFFIRYLRLLNWRNALAWGLTTLVATCFRLEGVVLLLLAPTAILLRPYLTLSKKFFSIVQLNAINIIGASLVIGWLLVHHQFNLEHILRVKDWVFTHYSALFQNNLPTTLALLQKDIFTNGDYSAIPFFLFTGVFGIFLESFINTLGLIYLGFCYHAIRYRLIPMDAPATLGWLTYLLLNFLIIFVFATIEFFVAERYVALFCLILALAVPFSIATLFDHWQQKKPAITGRAWILPVVLVCLGFCAVDSFGHFGPSKAYIVEAGRWLAQNTTTTSRIFSNNVQLSYYSGRINPNDPMSSLNVSHLSSYDYIALVIFKDQTAEEQQIISLLKSDPVVVFANKRGDKAIIFKTHSLN